MRALFAAALLLLIAACGGATVDAPPRSSPSATPLPPATPTTSPVPRVAIVAAGDVMLGRTIGEGIRQFGPLWPFEHVSDVLRAADVAFVNLESPLTERGEPAAKDFVFRGPPDGAAGLAEAGVDVVSLANNHALDYGLRGLADTRAALMAAGVVYAGAGDDETSARAPAIIQRNGLRLAFLAYVNTPADSVSGFDVSGTAATADRPGVAWLTPEAVAADVAAARQRADIVIVSMHTGREYQEAPTELQVAAAHAAIDAGASLVLGGHPHVLQGIERYGQGLIIYSLGNFVFDFDSVDYAQPGLPSALSLMLRLEVTKDGVTGCELVPAVIDASDGRPRPTSGAEAQIMLDRMRPLSDGSCGLEPGQ